MWYYTQLAFQFPCQRNRSLGYREHARKCSWSQSPFLGGLLSLLGRMSDSARTGLLAAAKYYRALQRRRFCISTGSDRRQGVRYHCLIPPWRTRDVRCPRLRTITTVQKDLTPSPFDLTTTTTTYQLRLSVIFLLYWTVNIIPVGFFGYEIDVSPHSRYCSNDRKRTDTSCDRQRIPGVREWTEPVKYKDHGPVFYHKQDIGEHMHSLFKGFSPVFDFF